ncbi:hypothetical protein LTR56_018094, partial [Elasticomyces elasticus]
SSSLRRPSMLRRRPKLSACPETASSPRCFSFSTPEGLADTAYYPTRFSDALLSSISTLARPDTDITFDTCLAPIAVSATENSFTICCLEEIVPSLANHADADQGVMCVHADPK